MNAQQILANGVKRPGTVKSLVEHTVKLVNHQREVSLAFVWETCEDLCEGSGQEIKTKIILQNAVFCPFCRQLIVFK